MNIVDRDRIDRRLSNRSRRSRRGWPPLIPAPAIHMQNRGDCGRGLLPLLVTGMRPNSPPQTTSVLSNKPRCLRSVNRPAIGTSVSWQRGVWLSARPPWASHFVVAVDLHEPDAALDHAAGEQAFSPRLGPAGEIETVHRLRRIRFPTQVSRLRSLPSACDTPTRSCRCDPAVPTRRDVISACRPFHFAARSSMERCCR